MKLLFIYLLSGALPYRILIFTVWLCCFQAAVAEKNILEPKYNVPYKFEISDPPMGIFDPIEISPSVVPRNPYPIEPLSPMYPSFPSTYDPVLTGKCPINFTSISNIIDKTASDCSAPLAGLVGNAICCPQLNSLVHILQGSYSSQSDALVLEEATADNCFSDIMSILESRGANSSIPTLCSVKSSNLTGGSCPVKEIPVFEKIVNTSKLLELCSIVDPMKECCRPICHSAIMEAALHISSTDSSVLDGSNIGKNIDGQDVINDCKGVVYAWLSRMLSSEAANKAFRLLAGCKINKACPLKLEEPSSVIKECRKSSSSNSSCCTSLNSYIATVQKQMLITNRQAINCATLFGSMLQKGGIRTNIYELCDVDLKDFSLQAYGQQGCLLRSLPTDVIYDNTTGFSFTCDLSDNIAAPWPSSSSVSSLSFCAPEMSLPALPLPHISGDSGSIHHKLRLPALLFLYMAHNMFMKP